MNQFDTNLIIGNCISVVAAVFTAKSSWSKDKWHIYIYQVIQCLLLAVASIFFCSYAGIVSLLVCALRNYLAATDRLNKYMMLLCLVLVLVPGVLVNNRGYIGYIVITANAIYTVGMYLARKEPAIKGNIILNLVLWIIYEALIIDIPSIIADGVGLAVAVASFFRKTPGENQKIEDTAK